MRVNLGEIARISVGWRNFNAGRSRGLQQHAVVVRRRRPRFGFALHECAGFGWWHFLILAAALSGPAVWAAGVAASPITKLLGRETDRAGRVSVGPSLDVPGVPDVFVVGDASSVKSDGRPVPGVAQAALQQGAYVGALIAEDAWGRRDA